MKKIKIAPSVLAADMLHLEDEICRASSAGADMLHLDIMDGVYVPNISFGFDTVKAISRITDTELDVHMMTSCPDRYIEKLRDCGADRVTLHENTCVNGSTREALEKIKSCGMKTGFAVKPGESAETALEYLDIADMILVMTVEPGFGGQSFMSDMLPKIEKIRTAADRLGIGVEIQVDGGISEKSAAECASRGADVFVAGTSLFRADDMKSALERMRRAAEEAFGD